MSSRASEQGTGVFPETDGARDTPHAVAGAGAWSMLSGHVLSAHTAGRAQPKRVLADALSKLWLVRVRESVVLLDAASRILCTNELARRTLERVDGLRAAAHGRLEATYPSSEVVLSRSIQIAQALGDVPSVSVAAIVTIDRGGGRLPFLASVARIPPADRRQQTAYTPAVAVFFRDPDAIAAGLGAALRERYGLTASEAVVACGLFDGHSVPSLAARLGLTANTVRSHVKATFAKMEVHKQSQFVRACVELVSSDPTVPPT